MCKIFFTFTGNTVSSITEPSSLTLFLHVDDFWEEFPHIFSTPHFPFLSFPSHTDDIGKSFLTPFTPLTFPSLQNPPHSHTSLTDDFGKSPSRRTKSMMGGGALSLVMIAAVMILDN